MIQNVWFDDAATLAMGEAFDNGSAVPAIIADLIIAAAKNGERDPARLYEQAVIIFAIEDTSMPLVSVGRDPAVPTHAIFVNHSPAQQRGDFTINTKQI
jgi:hypothetical protein